MIDAEDLVLVENGAQLGVELHRGLEVGAERLFDDHARETAVDSPCVSPAAPSARTVGAKPFGGIAR